MIQYHFPTAILTEFHPITAKAMLPVARKYLDDSNIASTKWGYTTTYGFENPGGIAYMPDVEPFRILIEKTGRKYLHDLGYDSKSIEFFSFVFVSEMFDGASHDEHTHPESILSGLLYLQVPPGSSSLILTDPRPFRDFVHIPKLDNKPTSTNVSELSIEPKNGLLLMWESWLPHLVPKTKNKDNGRITMVFNICRKSA
jgi:uncharacterized protein (TIGR02466 family)